MAANRPQIPCQWPALKANLSLKRFNARMCALKPVLHRCRVSALSLRIRSRRLCRAIAALCSIFSSQQLLLRPR